MPNGPDSQRSRNTHYDTEKLIYEPIYEFMDLNPLVENYAYRVSGGQSGHDVVLSGKDFEVYLKNIKIKNGFVMTIVEFETMNAQMKDLKAQCQALIAIIDQEMKAG